MTIRAPHAFVLPITIAALTFGLPRAFFGQGIGSPITRPTTQTSTVPRSMPFNGQVLTAEGDARTGAVLLTFGLYTDQQGGTPIWTEQQLVTLDKGGRYSVILGNTGDGLPADAFAAGIPKWFGVQVEGNHEQPRFMLLSVPYALKAGDADTIAGKPVSEFVLSAHLPDTVKSTLKEEGYVPKASNPTVSTVGRLAKFVDTTNGTGDSIVTESGGKIGINMASPAFPFHVSAASSYQALRLDDTHIVGSSFTLGPTGFAGEHPFSLLATGPGASTGAGYLTVYDEFIGAYRLVIDPSGNVGMGTVNPARAKLETQGAVGNTIA
jgi:hypothetical protein